MQSIHKILLATDFSAASKNALHHAAVLAAKHKAELHVVHVNIEAVPVYGLGGLPVPSEIPEEMRHDLEKRVGEFAKVVGQPVISAVEWGFSAPQMIAKYARKHAVDLVVVGTHAREGVSRFFLGSVAAETARTAPTPVLVVAPSHPISEHGYRSICACVDFSQQSLDAMHSAALFMHDDQTRLTVAHVVNGTEIPPYYPEKFAKADREKAKETLYEAVAGTGLPVAAETVVAEGSPHLKLVELAEEHNADLMVMASRGLGMIDRWFLGSVTERVLRHAPCAMLVYREVETAGQE